MAFPPIWRDKPAAVQKFHFPETGCRLADFGSDGIRTEVLSIGLTHFLARTGIHPRITSEGMLSLENAQKKQNAPVRKAGPMRWGKSVVVVDWLPVFSSRRLGRKQSQSR
jgi:hypothetical protein